MSVTETIILPNQPSGGQIDYVPLGGDGWTSPQSAFLGSCVLTGNAGGGEIRINIDRDERYEHVLSWLAIQINQAVALDYRFSIRRRAGFDIHQMGVTPASTVTSDPIAGILWCPPAMIDPIRWSGRCDNVDTQDVTVQFLVYNFNIRASEKVPLASMLLSLPRGATVV